MNPQAGGALLEVEWREFYIKDIFPTIQRGKRLVREKQSAGNTPYVSSSALNNGVDYFVSNSENIRRFANCISLANSGSVGSCFYEPFEFIASDHVTHLKNPKLNKWHYLFIATIMKRLSAKYNFNREISDSRISREKVLLPICQNGEIDYRFMETFSKSIANSRCNDYLKYCGCIS